MLTCPFGIFADIVAPLDTLDQPDTHFLVDQIRKRPMVKYGQTVKGQFSSRIRRGKTVSWQHPVVQLALPTIDLFDRIARQRANRAHLPRYSERIRSNGIKQQFGGRLFLDSGRADVAGLIKRGMLSSKTDVLDIGCGVGRMATALLNVLQTGKYVGLDVDQISIRACQENSLFWAREFHFDHIDFETDLYNPLGSLDPTSNVLPVESSSTDLIVAMSVFTHLFSDECKNYASEMLRIIRPEGAILVTAFVLDPDGSDVGFPHKISGGHVRTKAAPRKAIAHDWQDFIRWFGQSTTLVRGQWHSMGTSEAPRSQDWIVVRPDR